MAPVLSAMSNGIIGKVSIIIVMVSMRDTFNFSLPIVRTYIFTINICLNLLNSFYIGKAYRQKHLWLCIVIMTTLLALATLHK